MISKDSFDTPPDRQTENPNPSIDEQHCFIKWQHYGFSKCLSMQRNRFHWIWCNWWPQQKTNETPLYFSLFFFSQSKQSSFVCNYKAIPTRINLQFKLWSLILLLLIPVLAPFNWSDEEIPLFAFDAAERSDSSCCGPSCIVCCLFIWFTPFQLFHSSSSFNSSLINLISTQFIHSIARSAGFAIYRAV